MPWRNRPTIKKFSNPNIDYIMFIDENGNSNLKDIKKAFKANKNVSDENKYFTTTGVIIKTTDIPKITELILDLKNRYWENGLFKYKGELRRVCFHSREIRRGEGAFNQSVIDRQSFLTDLTDTLNTIPATIISSTINKYNHYYLYRDRAEHPYKLCLSFILERFARFYMKDYHRGIVILEARGKDEDIILLDHMKGIIDNGTYFVDNRVFNKIKGIYFNPKWDDACGRQRSYFGLEIADLFSYPIHKYSRSSIKDSAFAVIENKIYKYPNYNGYGIKVFPKK